MINKAIRFFTPLLVAVPLVLQSACGDAGPAPSRIGPPAETLTKSVLHGVPNAPAGAHSPRRSSFAPGLLVEAADSSALFILGTAPCGSHLCPELWRGTGPLQRAVQHLGKISPPPSGGATFAGSGGSVRSLVFANAKDGYALEGPSGVPAALAPVFATVDGGRSWHASDLGAQMTVMSMVASNGEFYAVTASCNTTGTPACNDYRLARSIAGSASWSDAPIGSMSAAVEGDNVQLGVAGGSVWLTYQDLSTGGSLLVHSLDGVPPFTTTNEPSLVGVTACKLSPMPGGVLWAQCPTGMNVSYLQSPGVGQPFRAVLGTPGTAGAAFDPVTGDLAYAYLGSGADELARTVDGGSRFVVVARLATKGISAEQLLFVNEREGLATVSVPSRGSGDRLFIWKTTDGGRDWAVVTF